MKREKDANDEQKNQQIDPAAPESGEVCGQADTGKEGEHQEAPQVRIELDADLSLGMNDGEDAGKDEATDDGHRDVVLSQRG